MSIESIALVLHHAVCSGTEKVVLLGIANHDGDGGAWPAIATLAKYACVSERSVQNAISGLAEKGLITIHLQGGGVVDSRNDRRPNRYELHVRCPETCDGTKSHGVKPPSPRGSNGVKVATERSEGGYLNGVKVASPEPSLEPELEPEAPPPDGSGGEVRTLPKPHAYDHDPAVCCLVARWYDGWSSTHPGEKPDPSVTKRVAGQARNVAKDRRTHEDWVRAAAAAFSAGEQGIYDIIQGIPVQRRSQFVSDRVAEERAIFTASDEQVARRAARDAEILAQRAATGR